MDGGARGCRNAPADDGTVVVRDSTRHAPINPALDGRQRAANGAGRCLAGLVPEGVGLEPIIPPGFFLSLWDEPIAHRALASSSDLAATRDGGCLSFILHK